MTSRIEKLRKCECQAELDGFLKGCRDYGEPLTAEETKAAQELRAELMRKSR